MGNLDGEWFSSYITNLAANSLFSENLQGNFAFQPSFEVSSTPEFRGSHAPIPWLQNSEFDFQEQRNSPAGMICPLLSGLIFILEMAMKEEWNGKEAQVGGDHRQAA